MRNNNRAYGKFAGVYDQLNSDLHSVKMAQKTFDLIDHFDIPVENCLDLCCGTGTAVRIFSEAGYRAEGLDGSPAMLKEARAKLKQYKSRLYCQKIPTFRIPEKRGSSQPRTYDLITSFFDSLTAE